MEVYTHLSQIFWYTTIEIHASHCRASASVTVYIVHLYAVCRKKTIMQEGISLSRERVGSGSGWLGAAVVVEAVLARAC